MGWEVKDGAMVNPESVVYRLWCIPGLVVGKMWDWRIEY